MRNKSENYYSLSYIRETTKGMAYVPKDGNEYYKFLKMILEKIYLR